MKLLLDENLSPLHGRALRELGHDVVSIVELGFSGADDQAVRQTANEQGRILTTLDRDFGNVVRYPPGETPGVILLRLHPATEADVNSLLRSAVTRLSNVPLKGKLAVVDKEKIRLR